MTKEERQAKKALFVPYHAAVSALWGDVDARAWFERGDLLKLERRAMVATPSETLALDALRLELAYAVFLERVGGQSSADKARLRTLRGKV